MISQYKIAILDLYGCQKTVTKSSLSITISVVTITEKDCTVLVFTKFSNFQLGISLLTYEQLQTEEMQEKIMTKVSQIEN